MREHDVIEAMEEQGFADHWIQLETLPIVWIIPSSFVALTSYLGTGKKYGMVQKGPFKISHLIAENWSS